MHHPTERITHTTAFVTPVVDHWLEREIAQWVGSGGFCLIVWGLVGSGGFCLIVWGLFGGLGRG